MKTRIAIACMVALIGTVYAATVAAPMSIRLRDKAKYLNEAIVVQGITGRKLDDISQSTRLYTLVDDFGDSIKVRTSQEWPPIGVTFRVNGTVVYDGKLSDYVLVETSRVSISGQARPTSGSTVPTPSPTGVAGSGETKAQNDTLLIVGLALLIVAGVGLLLMATSMRRRRRAESRRRQREEAERAKAATFEPAARTSSPIPPTPATARERTVSMGAQRENPNPPLGSDRGVTREAWGRLQIIDGPGVGTSYPLMGNKTVIGRDPNIDVSLTQDDNVSRQHCTLVRTNDGRVLFIDESRNGSRINGRLVHMGQVELVSGTKVEIGMTTLNFEDFRQLTVSADVPASRRPTIQTSGVNRSTIPHADIVVITGPDAPKRLTLGKRITTIGRLDDRDIQLTDPAVSRKHVTLSFDGEAFVLQNESPNGTFVNNARIERAQLKGNEEIKIGDTLLRLDLRSE